MNRFFADTYAILAQLMGDGAYRRRFREAAFITGFLNIYEAYHTMVSRDVDPAEAARRLAPHRARAKWPTWDVLENASTARLDLRRRGHQCSYIDAAGYAHAMAEGVAFLTGDAAFRGEPGVDFLKARSRRT